MAGDKKKPFFSSKELIKAAKEREKRLKEALKQIK